MKKHTLIIGVLALLLAPISLRAQNDRNKSIIRSALNGLEYEVKAGISIGGTAPLPLPVEIRSIDKYNPNLAISIAGEVTKWLDTQKEWGIIVGLRLENKSMLTEATVKNYS
ncbi:MAG: outer membrane beta-barrel protein, partial [Bacteroides sp.]